MHRPGIIACCLVIRVVAAPGATNLNRNTAQDRRAVWSPDGGKIPFTSNRDGNNEIHVRPVTTGH